MEKNKGLVERVKETIRRKRTGRQPRVHFSAVVVQIPQEASLPRKINTFRESLIFFDPSQYTQNIEDFNDESPLYSEETHHQGSRLVEVVEVESNETNNRAQSTDEPRLSHRLCPIPHQSTPRTSYYERRDSNFRDNINLLTLDNTSPLTKPKFLTKFRRRRHGTKTRISENARRASGKAKFIPEFVWSAKI